MRTLLALVCLCVLPPQLADSAPSTAPVLRVRVVSGKRARAKIPVQMRRIFDGLPGSDGGGALVDVSLSRRVFGAGLKGWDGVKASKTDSRGYCRIPTQGAGVYVLRIAQGERLAFVSVSPRAKTVSTTIDLAKGPQRVRGAVTRHRGRRELGSVALFWCGHVQQTALLWEAVGPKAPTSDGTFAFEALPKGRAILALLNSKGQIALMQPVVPGVPIEISNEWFKSYTVGGCVRSHDGARLPGAQVALRGGTVLTKTDARGNYRFPLSGHGQIQMVVTADGYATALPVSIIGLDETQVEDFDLLPESVIRGTVTQKGKPLPDVEVLALLPPAPVDLEQKSERSRRAYERRVLRETYAFRGRTDEQGRYVIRGLAPGGYLVGVREPKWTSAKGANADDAFVLLDVGSEKTVDLRCIKTVSLVGVVKDAAGKPVRRIPVIANSLHAGPPDVRSVLTDSKGRFSLRGLRPGRGYMVFSESPTLSGSSKAVKLSGAKTQISLSVSKPRWVETTVRLWPGEKPVAGAAITTGVVDDDDMLGALSIRPLRPFVWWTDESGQARVGPTRPTAESLYVVAAPAGTRTLTLRVPLGAHATQSATVPLGRRTSLAGRVLLPDGKPASDGRVTLRNRAIRRHAEIQPDGRFRFDRIRALSYGLHAVVVRDGTVFSTLR